MRSNAHDFHKEKAMNSTSRIKRSHLIIAGLVAAVAVLAFVLWQESRTERVEFSFGGETIEIEANR